MSHTRLFTREHELDLRSSPPKTPIRLADEHDEIGILDMVRLMHAEQPYHDLDIGRVAALVRIAVQPSAQRHGIVGVIGEPRGPIKAGIFLSIEPLWYSSDKVLLEYFNYVRPEARKGSTYANDLIAYAKQCSDHLGLDLTIGVYSTIRTAAKIRLYRRWMIQVGAFFLYAPPNRQPVYDRIAGLSIAAE